MNNTLRNLRVGCHVSDSVGKSFSLFSIPTRSYSSQLKNELTNHRKNIYEHKEVKKLTDIYFLEIHLR